MILEKKDYIEKTKQLLQDTNTYRTIQADPTTKLKNRLITKLKKIKLDTGLDEPHIKECIQLEQLYQNSMGYQKSHKENTPLRPIVSSIGSVSYGVAKK